ncbi:MAG: hypothetical protein JXR88_01745 [Clostridia bacterium]|nr:hypothetical protein [Clostridia bacterium]
MIGFLSIIGIGTLFLIFFAVISGIIGYLLSGIALQRMARKAGIEEQWLAWIPVGNLYIIGKLIKTLEFGGKSYEQAEYILPGVFLVTTILGRIAFLGSIPTLLMWLITMTSLFMLYKRYAPDKVSKYMAISIFVPIIGASVVLFRIKDLQPLASK